MCADKVAIDDGSEQSQGNWNQPGPPRTAIANHHIMMQHRLFTYDDS